MLVEQDLQLCSTLVSRPLVCLSLYNLPLYYSFPVQQVLSATKCASQYNMQPSSFDAGAVTFLPYSSLISTSMKELLLCFFSRKTSAMHFTLLLVRGLV